MPSQFTPVGSAMNAMWAIGRADRRSPTWRCWLAAAVHQSLAWSTQSERRQGGCRAQVGSGRTPMPLPNTRHRPPQGPERSRPIWGAPLLLVAMLIAAGETEVLPLATLHFCHCERPAVGRGAKQSPSSPGETRFGLQLDLEIASGAKNAPSQ
jgi:hypothetical protein